MVELMRVFKLALWFPGCVVNAGCLNKCFCYLWVNSVHDKWGAYFQRQSYYCDAVVAFNTGLTELVQSWILEWSWRLWESHASLWVMLFFKLFVGHEEQECSSLTHNPLHPTPPHHCCQASYPLLICLVLDCFFVWGIAIKGFPAHTPSELPSPSTLFRGHRAGLRLQMCGPG